MFKVFMNVFVLRPLRRLLGMGNSHTNGGAASSSSNSSSSSGNLGGGISSSGNNNKRRPGGSTSGGSFSHLMTAIRVVEMALYAALLYGVLTTFVFVNTEEYIVVVGDGATAGGEVPRHVQLRVARAAELFDQRHGRAASATVVALSQGDPKKPFPLDKQGFPVYDAAATAKALIAAGVPATQILEENMSMDTEGNAYFLRTMHVDPANVRRLTVVTNRWHMPRTKAVFNKVFSMPHRADSFYGVWMDMLKSACFWNPTWPYRILYEDVGDGMGAAAASTRRAAEDKRMHEFVNVTQHRFIDMEMMHDWMFIENEPYAVWRIDHLRKSALP